MKSIKDNMNLSRSEYATPVCSSFLLSVEGPLCSSSTTGTIGKYNDYEYEGFDSWN